MAFRLSSFLGGAAKGATDLIEEREKENALQIKDSIKNMYHNYAEYRKETEKKKEEIRETVGSLRSFKFSDGVLDDKELIALASDLPTAKSIAEEFRKNPEKLEGLSKSFIKSTGKIPEGMTFNDYVNQYGKVAKMDAAEFEQAASGKQDGFLNKMVYGNNVTKIRNAAAKYGVSAEELYNVGATKGSKAFPALLEVDYAKLQKTPEFKDLKDKSQVLLLKAKQTGTDEEILKASQNFAIVLATDTLGKNEKKDKLTQADIEIDYGKRVLNATDPKEKAKLKAELRAQQDLWANPSLKTLSPDEKVTTGNKLTAYKGIVNSTIENYLPPGSFIIKENGDLEVKELGQSAKFAQGKQAGREAAIRFGTNPDGKPKSIQDQLALASIGVQFDENGKAYAPKIDYPSEVAPQTPAKPKPRTGRDGGPMSPQPKPASASSAQATPINVESARAEAKVAIDSGADRAAVAARFKQQTGQDL